MITKLLPLRCLQPDPAHLGVMKGTYWVCSVALAIVHVRGRPKPVP
jgi:hypothetical protein